MGTAHGPNQLTTTVEATPETNAEPSPRQLGWVLLATGLVGGGAAFVLAVEKFWLLTNPFYTPSCTVNARFSCGPVMTSPPAELFGFPNPLLGIAGFAALAATGAALLAGGRLTGWYRAALQVGVTAGVIFVHWLIVQSVFVIGALCPYCMVVWAVTITAFCYLTLHNLTLHNLTAAARRRPDPARSAVAALARNPGAVVAVWLSAVAALVVVTTFLA